MTDDSAQISVLLAREEIREVLARVAKGTDRQDKALIRSGYHEDGIDDHGGSFYGTGSEFADFAVTRMAGARSQHFIGQSLIEVRKDVAFSEMYANCHVLYSSSPAGKARDFFHGVRYLDRFERRSGGPWLIAHRLVCWDWAFYLPADMMRDEFFADVWGCHGKDDPSYHIAEFPLQFPNRRKAQ